MKLIDNWRTIWFRRVSTWLAAVNGMFVAYVFSQPVLVVGLLGFAPGEWIIPLAATLGFLAFVLPVIVAHWPQPKLHAKIKAKEDSDGLDV